MTKPKFSMNYFLHLSIFFGALDCLCKIKNFDFFTPSIIQVSKNRKSSGIEWVASTQNYLLVFTRRIYRRNCQPVIILTQPLLKSSEIFNIKMIDTHFKSYAFLVIALWHSENPVFSSFCPYWVLTHFLQPK